MPAKAGIQGRKLGPETLDSRLRGNDGEGGRNESLVCDGGY